MSERLLALINEYALRTGKNWKAKLAVRAGLSVSTLETIRRGHVPLAENLYRVALACGAKEEEARAMVESRASLAKESA